jgi:hypothetical protein
MLAMLYCKNEILRSIIILDYTHSFLLIFIYFSIESGKKEVFKSIRRLLFIPDLQEYIKKTLLRKLSFF